MEFYVIPVLAGMGVCGNILALLVWTKEQTFNASTFLIKCLAVSDLCFCLVKVCSVNYWPDSLPVLLTGLTVYSFCRVISVNTTLAIVFSRWLAVSWPFRVHTLLTKRRTLWSYGLLLAWSVLVATVDSLLLWGVIPGVVDGLLIADMNAYMALRFTLQGVGLVVPILDLLLVLLNVSLVCVLCRQRGAGSDLGQRSVEAREARANRVLPAVICLSVSTVLSYPLGLVSDSLVLVAKQVLANACGLYCYLVFYRASDFLETFNSSVNVVYYLLFASHFRQLLRLRFSFCRLCQTVE